MNISKKHLYVFFASTIFLAIALAVWRVVLLVKYYDPNDRVFSDSASGGITAIGIILFVVTLIILCIYFPLRKQGPATIDPPGQSTIFTASLSAFILLGSLIVILFFYRHFLFTSKYLIMNISKAMIFILAIPIISYFILSASFPKANGSALKYTSFFPPLWTMFYLICSYFNPNYTFNDPNRILINMSLIAVIMFFLMETRYRIGYSIPPLYFVFGMIATFIGLVYTLPQLFLTAFWIIGMSEDFFYELIEFFFVLYIASRCYTFIKTFPATEKLPETEIL